MCAFFIVTAFSSVPHSLESIIDDRTLFTAVGTVSIFRCDGFSFVVKAVIPGFRVMKAALLLYQCGKTKDLITLSFVSSLTLSTSLPQSQYSEWNPNWLMAHLYLFLYLLFLNVDVAHWDKMFSLTIITVIAEICDMS